MNEFIPFLFFFAILIGFAIIARFFQKEKRRKRTDMMAEIASELGAEYRAEHPWLINHIKGLMSGRQYPRVYNSMRFPAGEGELFLVEYSHVIKSGKSSRRVYRHAAVMPISTDNKKAVPLFYLRRRRMSDGLSHLFGWPRVELSWNTRFNRQMGLKTKPNNVDEVRLFFDQHEQLAEFCLHHHDYHVVSDGRWLALYKPNHYIEAQTDLFRDQLDLAKQLYGCIWSVEEDGKSAVFDSFLDTPEAEFWSDSPDSYDDHLKSLKES